MRATRCCIRIGADVDDPGFQHLAEAYEILRDPRRRLQYDAQSLDAEPLGRDEYAAATSRLDGSCGNRRPGSPSPIERSSEWAQSTLLLLVVVLALTSAITGALWRMWRQLDASETAQAEAAGRYAELADAQRELQGRYRAQLASKADAAGGGDWSWCGGHRASVVAGDTVPDRLGRHRPTARGDDRQRRRGAVEAVRLSGPERWLVVVEATRRCRWRRGSAVPSWETALLRIGGVIDGTGRRCPRSASATRFQAGFASAAIDSDMPVVELKLLCCFR